MSQILKNDLSLINLMDFKNQSKTNRLIASDLSFEYFPYGFLKLGFFTTINKKLIYHYDSRIKYFISDHIFNVVKVSLSDLVMEAYLSNNYNKVSITKDYIYFNKSGFIFRIKNELIDRKSTTIQHFLENKINTDYAKLIGYMTTKNILLQKFLSIEYNEDYNNPESFDDTYVTIKDKKEIVIFNKYIKDNFIKRLIAKNKLYPIKIIYKNIKIKNIFDILRFCHGFKDLDFGNNVFNPDLYFNVKNQSIVDKSPKKEKNNKNLLFNYGE